MAQVRVITERHPEEMEKSVNKFIQEHENIDIIQYKTMSQFAALTAIVYDVTEKGELANSKIKIFTGQKNAELEAQMNEFLEGKKFIDIQTEIVNEYEISYMIIYEE